MIKNPEERKWTHDVYDKIVKNKNGVISAKALRKNSHLCEDYMKKFGKTITINGLLTRFYTIKKASTNYLPKTKTVRKWGTGRTWSIEELSLINESLAANLTNYDFLKKYQEKFGNERSIAALKAQFYLQRSKNYPERKHEKNKKENPLAVCNYIVRYVNNEGEHLSGFDTESEIKNYIIDNQITSNLHLRIFKLVGVELDVNMKIFDQNFEVGHL